MNKAQLVSAVAQKAGMTKKDAEKFVNAFIETVTEELSKGEKVQLVGFGSFSVRKRAEKKGVNPQNKKPIVIPAAVVPKFKAGKGLVDVVNK